MIFIVGIVCKSVNNQELIITNQNNEVYDVIDFSEGINIFKLKEDQLNKIQTSNELKYKDSYESMGHSYDS
ncbi:hypothetical protein J2T56_003272 [Natronobacillus azotifigens]